MSNCFNYIIALICFVTRETVSLETKLVQGKTSTNKQNRDKLVNHLLFKVQKACD